MSVSNRVAQHEELVRRFASALRSVQLYALDHPLVSRNLEAFNAVLTKLHADAPSIAIGVIRQELVVADTPLIKASSSLSDLIARLQDIGVERITIDRGVTVAETRRFIEAVARAASRPDASKSAAPELPTLPHIRVGQIAAGDRRREGQGGGMEAIQQRYGQAVEGAETLWQSAATEGKSDMAVAQSAMEDLADAVAHNRTAVIALTAMQRYNNYTFTHMVNVSILTMGQARALGIEGQPLRELGLSALMHDIGKVRTPIEILDRPEKLTDAEFAVMKRHVVDGAEILRKTPEMPVLAPVIAFEHHLRLDGTGYPEAVSRARLNLGTMLCSIADVFDAMRSQRAYQQSFPTDRILAVLKRADGKQFDQHLVRRFTQLIGIYPPGNLVRLSTGEIAASYRCTRQTRTVLSSRS